MFTFDTIAVINEDLNNEHRPKIKNTKLDVGR